MVKNKIGIMCGRLSASPHGELQAFPYTRWRQEFSVYSQLDIDSVEWLFDGLRNPLLSVEGRKAIRELSDRNNVAVHSVMAQYFIRKPLFGRAKPAIEEDTEILLQLVEASFHAGIKMIEMPLMEEAEIKNEGDEDEFVRVIQEDIVPSLEKRGLLLSLETSLVPQAFASLLERLNHPLIKATFDIGNSAFLSYDPSEEVRRLAPWLAQVHIKDRNGQGENVPLGQGAADFAKVFRALDKIQYNGDYILETYKGEPNASDEHRQSRVRAYLAFLNPFLNESRTR